MLESLWPDTVVEEGNLSVSMLRHPRTLRSVLPGC